MAKEVIKKDGSRQPFDSEKIRNSIRGAAVRTDLPEERQNEVVEQVAKAAIELADTKEEIATSEIKEKILSELDRIEPAVSAAWRKHEEEKGAGGETEEPAENKEPAETKEPGDAGGEEESKEEPTV